MPTYTVQLRINVPSIGEANVDFPGIVAPDIPQAITQAMALVIREAIIVQKTAA